MSSMSYSQSVVVRDADRAGDDRGETDRCLKGSGVSSDGEIDAIIVDSDPEC
jgi:hypothetical protein